MNGDLEHRVPHNLNISFNLRRGRIDDHGDQGSGGIVGFGLHLGLAGTILRAARSAVTTSWRTARSASPSDVSPPRKRSTTRSLLHQKIGKLRELSPLWEMVQEGVDLNTVQWAAHGNRTDGSCY